MSRTLAGELACSHEVFEKLKRASPRSTLGQRALSCKRNLEGK